MFDFNPSFGHRDFSCNPRRRVLSYQPDRFFYNLLQSFPTMVKNRLPLHRYFREVRRSNLQVKEPIHNRTATSRNLNSNSDYQPSIVSVFNLKNTTNYFVRTIERIQDVKTDTTYNNWPTLPPSRNHIIIETNFRHTIDIVV